LIWGSPMWGYFVLGYLGLGFGVGAIIMAWVARDRRMIEDEEGDWK
jgi:hypothetical protein